jgi:tetratricopeptide (TPR) repeat protein
MLYRMTALRQGWDWAVMRQLGEAEEAEAEAEATADELARTSLVLREERGSSPPRFSLHPETAAFVRKRFGDDEELRKQTHLRVGAVLESAVVQVTDKFPLDFVDEAGYHLEMAGESERSQRMRRLSQCLAVNELFRAILLRTIADLKFEDETRENREEALEYITSDDSLYVFSFRAISYSLGMVPTLVRERILNVTGTGAASGARGQVAAPPPGILSELLTIGKVEAAIHLLAWAVQASREAKDFLAESHYLCELGRVYNSLGQNERAAESLERALAVSRDAKDRRGEGVALGKLGGVYVCLGQLGKAAGFYVEALQASREVKDRSTEIDLLCDLGGAYACLGQAESTAECFKSALDACCGGEHRLDEGRVLYAFGNAYFVLGQSDLAVRLLEEAQSIGQDVGKRLGDLGLLHAASDKLARLRGGVDTADAG